MRTVAVLGWLRATTPSTARAGRPTPGLLDWFRRILLSGRFTRSVALLAGGTILGQAAVVLVSPILTRLYTPADFGILAVYISCLAILGAMASLSYDFAIPLPADDETAASLVVLALAIVLGMCGVSVLAVWLMGDQITRLLGMPELRPFLWLLPLGLVGVGAYQAFNGWAIRKGDFRRVAQTKLSQGIGKSLAQVGLGLLSSGPFGLLVGDVIGRASGTGTLATLALRRDRALLRRVRLADLRQVAYRYRRFPLLSGSATLLNSLGLRLPTLLLASLYGAQVVGWLALGERIISGPLGLIGAAVSQVYVSEAAKTMRTAPEQLPKLLFKVIGGMLLIALPYVVILAVFAPTLFPIVFGSEWAEAGLYVRLLALMFLFETVATSVGGTLGILERQDLHLLRECTRVLLVSGVIVGVGYMHLAPVACITLMSVTGSIIYTFYLGLSIYAVRAKTFIDSEHGQITTLS